MRRYNRRIYKQQKSSWWVHSHYNYNIHRWSESLSLHLPEQVGQKNPRQVKARLDRGGLISNEGSTSLQNQHGEFTRTQTFTFIHEKCWLPARTAPHYSLLTAHYSLLSRVLASSQLFLLRISDIATTVPTKRLTKEVLTLYIWYEALQRGLLMYEMCHIEILLLYTWRNKTYHKRSFPATNICQNHFLFHSAFLFWKIWLSQK